MENWEVADFRDVPADVLHLVVKNERKEIEFRGTSFPESVIAGFVDKNR